MVVAKKMWLCTLSHDDIILDTGIACYIIGLKYSRQKKDKKRMNDASQNR